MNARQSIIYPDKYHYMTILSDTYLTSKNMNHRYCYTISTDSGICDINYQNANWNARENGPHRLEQVYIAITGDAS